MPIDKILEQVADDERDIVSQKSNEEQLVSGAKSILEKYLTQFFQGELPGQQTSLELDTQTRKAITTLGSDLFAIYPTKTRYDFYLKINLLNITDPRDIECIIRKMYGNEALKTDLYSFVDGSNPKKLEEILEEFMPSTKDFLETASTYNCKTILSNLMALETAIEKYTRCIS